MPDVKRHPLRSLLTALVILGSLMLVLVLSMARSDAAPAPQAASNFKMAALTTPLVQLEQQEAARALMVAAAVDPVPAYAPPPATYTVQSGDSLYGIGDKLVAAHPELQAKAGSNRFGDYLWTCIKHNRPNPHLIRVGDQLPLDCGITPDQVTPISSWTPPAPPAPAATVGLQLAAATQPAEVPAAAETAQVEAAAPAASGVVNPCQDPRCHIGSSFLDPTRSDTHMGTDISTWSAGTPVHAALGGTVWDVGPANGYGQWIVISQDDGTTAVYGHIVPTVWSGRVEAGQVIATIADMSGCPGCSGPHLHFEIHPDGFNPGSQIDSAQWLRDHGIAI